MGVETSCDETGVGLVALHDDGTVALLADEVASSVEQHTRFGGVVPEVASRAHLEAMVPTVDRAFHTAGLRRSDVTAIALQAGRGRDGPARCWAESPRPRRTPWRGACRCTA